MLNGSQLTLSLRPAELLTALALHPDGLTAERLALLLYGDDGNPTTVRGEILRLRAVIGTEVLRTRPYRLEADVDTDFGAVRRALRAGRPGRGAAGLRRPAAAAFGRPRDPRSARRAGGLAASRVLESDDVELLAEFAAHWLGRDDLEVHDRLLELLPATDRRRPHILSRHARLLAES